MCYHTQTCTWKWIDKSSRAYGLVMIPSNNIHTIMYDVRIALAWPKNSIINLSDITIAKYLALL